ncbi:MAG: Ig-like domain-containing protein [Gemmatimonadota bacterium]|nr:Ig-like domain-containing protein [Gemmatimonadota bacterium]
MPFLRGSPVARPAALRRTAFRWFAPLLLGMFAVGVQGCAAPADGGSTGTGGGGTGGSGGTPTRFESSVGTLDLAAIGASQTITVVARDAKGITLSGVAVSWTSSDPAIVDVAGSGTTAVVTARAPGKATVRARTGDLSLEISVTVLAIRSITLTPPAVTLIAGGQQPLTATVDADAGALRELRWITDNPSVASVNAQGVVTGVTPGSTVVRATAVGDPRVTASAPVTVTSAGTITLTPSTLTLATGDARALVATVTLEPGVSTALTWRTANSAVATVSATGVVTGVSVGNTVITAVSVADTTRRGTAAVTVAPAVRAVDVTPGTATIFAGDTRQLGVTVTADPGASQAVLWRSSNATVATVSSTGLVSGIASGTATITALSAADTTKRGSAVLTVRTVAVSVSPTAATIAIGGTRTLAATVTADNGLSTAVTWRSSNPAVATVSTGGVVTGVALGTTDVTAVSVADTTRRATASITVAPTVRAVDVTPGTATMFTGDTRQFAVTVTGDPGASQTVLWRSSSAAVATVSNAGLVSAIAPGTATITVLSATDSTKRGTALVTVRAAAVSLSPTTATVSIGGTRTLVATVALENGASTAVTWRSSNAAVATVSSGGVVTGIALGTTTVTAVAVADTTRRATASITVAPSVRSVTVTPTASVVLAGQTVQLVPTVVADAGVSTDVSYRSSNNAVASVSAAGLVTAIASGSASIITMAVADTTRRDTSAVTVVSGLANSWAATRLGGALYEDVVSISGINASTGFAVNVLGDLFRWNGGGWSLSARGAQFGTQFVAVHGTTAATSMAVGTNGVIVRFDGTNWNAVTSGTTNRLNGIFVESSTSAFAVGANGTALRWNGSNWTVGSTGATETLTSVWASGGTAFAVGGSGAVLRFLGGSWSRQSAPTIESLTSVTGASTTSVVAVGNGGTVLSYNGTTWTQVANGGIVADLFGVTALAPSDPRFFVASDDGLLLVVAGTLSRISTPYAPQLFAVSTDPTGALWVGGQRGSVQRRTGTTWATLSLAPDLLDVWSTSATNTWAVGEFGSVYQWNGSSWSRSTTPTTVTLNAVWGASATEAFAGGENGTMLRFNGTSWTAMSFPSAATVYGLWGSSASNVYAVTSAGEVVRFNGSSWSLATSTSRALLSIFGTSATNVIATGDNGTALRWTGSSWSTASVSTTGSLAGVWTGGTGATAVGANAAGTAGISFALTGSTWSALSTGSSRVLTSVWGTSASDLYVTGDQGTLLRYNGSAWSTLATGTTDGLTSVTGAPTGLGGAFAVGNNSTVVAGSNSAAFTTGMARALRVLRGTDLAPAAGVRSVPGPLPSGTQRTARRRQTLR